MAYLSILRQTETLFLGPGRETEVWKGGSDDMEGRKVFAADGQVG